MKAILINAPREVTVQEITDQSPGDEEVLIDVKYIGLCGSDLSSFRGTSPLVTYPRIPGHEVSGTIIRKGNSVLPELEIGDRVSVNPYSSCGLCPACRSGRVNTCERNQTLGVQRDGALTTFFAVHHSKVVKSAVLSLRELALVEPLSVGYHAANRGQVTQQDTVMVIGCGMIGIGAIVACLNKGANVIAVDRDETKLALVKSFGVTHTINASETDVMTRVRTLTNNEGVDVCIEAVGSRTTYLLAVDAVVFSGRVVYIGYAKEEIAFNTSLFVKKELTITGSRNAHTEFATVLKMLEDKRFPLDKAISKIFRMDETPVAFAQWDADPNAFIKILIDVQG